MFGGRGQPSKRGRWWLRNKRHFSKWWLMEGSYSKVWNTWEEAPPEEYKFFVDSLMGIIWYVTIKQQSSSHPCAGMRSQVVRRQHMKVFQSRMW